LEASQSDIGREAGGWIIEMSDMQETIDKIKKEAAGGWGGEHGQRLADEVEAFILKLLPEYAVALGLSQEAVLEAIETKRDYWAPNYYQAANFPSLKDVRVFETQVELRAAIPSMKFRCPHCGGISTDPYDCNSGIEVGGKRCDWKTYGLFRTLGKGFRFTIKEGFLERPRVDEIFMPVEMEEGRAAAAV
jgi:hypothetical protein